MQCMARIVSSFWLPLSSFCCTFPQVATARRGLSVQLRSEVNLQQRTRGRIVAGQHMVCEGVAGPIFSRQRLLSALHVHSTPHSKASWRATCRALLTLLLATITLSSSAQQPIGCRSKAV